MKINEGASGNQFPAVKSPFWRAGCCGPLGVILGRQHYVSLAKGCAVLGFHCGKMLLVYMPYIFYLLYMTREQRGVCRALL